MIRSLELVLLDRDGVLNRDLGRGLESAHEWTWLPGSRAAVRQLRDSDLRVMVVTNQANIGHGLLTEEELSATHRQMIQDLRPAQIAPGDILHCPHRAEDGCSCRKPQPGMILQALRMSGANPGNTLLIGDHESDIGAAEAAGIWSLHVQSGRGAPPVGQFARYLGSVADLAAAVETITRREFR